MDIKAGLNPYGLTYYLGLQGQGSPRENPNGTGLDGFISLAAELDGRAVEIAEGWLTPMSDAELTALKARLDDLGMVSIMSSGLQHCDFDALVRCAIVDGAIPFRDLKTPPEIIRFAVRRYVRRPCPLRYVEYLLYERGVGMSHEAARFWGSGSAHSLYRRSRGDELAQYR